MSADRKKRAAILESEGLREAAVNEAEGRKRAVILASEARRLEQTNHALGEAEAIRARASATASAIDMTSKAILQQVGAKRVALKRWPREGCGAECLGVLRESTALSPRWIFLVHPTVFPAFPVRADKMPYH